ncbi:MAG: cytochrome P460 family protein [Candidatus Poribacteria bacterium]|nr:cytochrome P460 family protein [Candidatus Poribacteria bacterium]
MATTQQRRHDLYCFLTLILLGCIALIACDETQLIMKPVAPPILSEEDARGIRIEITPTEQGKPAHGLGTRSVYINGIGVAALKDDTLKTFPVGTLIIKEINNNTNTFVQHVASMKKTDDPAYATHNGWFYTLYTRQTETAKFIAAGGDVPGSTSESCRACHTQAPKDSVFTQLPTPNQDSNDSHENEESPREEGAAEPEQDSDDTHENEESPPKEEPNEESLPDNGDNEPINEPI